jgi:predicted RecA/RadA family phage recombinase
MQATFVQQGDGIDFVAGADVNRGDVVVQGDLVGIATADVANGATGTITVEGVFDVVKDSSISISAGAKVYWDAVNSQAVTTATGNKLIGKAVEAAGSGATLVRVRLSQ